MTRRRANTINSLYATSVSSRMLVLSVGDARDVVKRIRTDHCSSNVEASALRKHVATHRGYTLNVTKRASGSRRVRINLPDAALGERAISRYLRSGLWKYVLCTSYAEANDVQWYAIDKLRPILNVERKTWDTRQEPRYAKLLTIATKSPGFTYNQLAGQPTGPGVYVLYHHALP